jgi:hypothetical protein
MPEEWPQLQVRVEYFPGANSRRDCAEEPAAPDVGWGRLPVMAEN